MRWRKSIGLPMLTQAANWILWSVSGTWCMLGALFSSYWNWPSLCFTRTLEDVQWNAQGRNKAIVEGQVRHLSPIPLSGLDCNVLPSLNIFLLSKNRSESDVAIAYASKIGNEPEVQRTILPRWMDCTRLLRICQKPIFANIASWCLPIPKLSY